MDLAAKIQVTAFIVNSRLEHHQATATAARHTFIVAARKARCVLVEIRWRWMMDCLGGAASTLGLGSRAGGTQETFNFWLRDAAVQCHDDFDADDVVVEVNFGGDMATEVVKQAAERAYQQGRRETKLIRIKEVTASRGKAMRAEPISLLYERGRVLHRRGLDQLESEMMSFSREWDRAVDGSPNRLDTAIWGLTRLSKVITQIPIV